MYNINESDIIDCIKNCNSAMSVKGQIIGYAIAHSGKNIENRIRPIKDGWYALHVGGSKEPTPKNMVIHSLIDSYDEKKLPPTSSIIGCFKIEGYVTQSDNHWFFGPVGNIITKYIHFKNSISNVPGHQSITYSLDTIDNKLKKRYTDKQERIRSRIIKELQKLFDD